MRSALVPKNFAQTVTHHMCTFIVTGFCMDAAMSHDVTETAEKTIVVSMVRRRDVEISCAAACSIAMWYASGMPRLNDVSGVVAWMREGAADATAHSDVAIPSWFGALFSHSQRCRQANSLTLLRLARNGPTTTRGPQQIFFRGETREPPARERCWPLFPAPTAQHLTAKETRASILPRSFEQ